MFLCISYIYFFPSFQIIFSLLLRARNKFGLIFDEFLYEYYSINYELTDDEFHYVIIDL